MYLLILLIISILFIIWGTTYLKINAFFVLFSVALFAGIFAGLPLDKIIIALKAGFGHTMEKIGLLIILGTALGVILEKTGTTIAMANFILKKVGESQSPLAISITGFVVGLPIFCDSGFIILSGLNQSLVKRAQLNQVMMASMLATALYSVHCLVPPHPGISAAVGKLGSDMGLVMLLGIGLAIPGAVFGYYWAKYRSISPADSNPAIATNPLEIEKNKVENEIGQAGLGFFCIFFPIFLIAFKSIALLWFAHWHNHSIIQIIVFVGEPIIALFLALLIALTLISPAKKSEIGHWLSESVEKAGIVLAIIAAGGTFGEMIQATNMSGALGEMLKPLHLGIFFPFLITFVLKTAQGSSTVAVITSASLVLPMLGELGLDSEWGRILAVLAMGAGSMAISHANDAYFWVVSKFSNTSPEATLRVYTTATIGMSIITQLSIFILYLILN
ncbi:MAG: GntP family permease [Microscillaceae bacterium]|jgi:GntP family gluconate:H+ symporter|nr:GntP family permease [Microscillaceae bacterium]